ESLPEPFRRRSIDLIRENCRDVDAYIATCHYYADFMAGYLGLPRDRMQVVYPGIKLPAYSEPAAQATGPDHPVARDPGSSPTIGYFARIAPEKGLHVLADAFILLRKIPGAPRYRLRVSGWLGKHNEPYLAEVQRKLTVAGLAEDFEHVNCPTHADKVRFLQSIDVLSVPTTYREPKGLYVLEALAHGVPVVQPRHGSFPELLERTGGGLLVNPDDPDDLAAGLRRLLDDQALPRAMGLKGPEGGRWRFTGGAVGRATVEGLGRRVG